MNPDNAIQTFGLTRYFGKCLACGKLRRADSETCEDRGASWAKNERQGIEIYDREPQETPVGV
jgi:lipocalin